MTDFGEKRTLGLQKRTKGRNVAFWPGADTPDLPLCLLGISDEE